MRVIAGKFRGKKLQGPKTGNKGIRPTADRVKEAIFSSLTPFLRGAVVIDLFAGTGSLGIEALSRGSGYAYFCDFSDEAIGTISANIKALGAEGLCRILSGDYRKSLKRIDESADLIFIDAPYDMCEYGAVLTSVAESGAAADGCIIVLERERSCGAYELPESAELLKTRRYGNTEVDFIKMRKVETE